MHRNLLPASLATALATLPAFAQAGNEIVFVGSSTSGSTDNHAFVESATGSILGQTGVGATNNVSDAVWTDTGRNLYVSQSLGAGVSRAAWNGANATWSTFYTAPGSCYGLGYDAGRRRLWTLTGPSGSARELVCLDADPASPGYGTVLTQTSVLTGASRERWALSPSGNLAAVPHVFLSSGLFELVDLDPASPSYRQILVSTPMPNAAASGFSFASGCRISIDDAYAYVLWTGLGTQGLAVWDVQAQGWLDFDPAPGQQDFAIALAVPNRMDLSLDRSFAVVSGQGGGGWALRIDFDYGNPLNTVGTQYPLGASVPNCNAVSLSPDQTRVAVSSTPVNLSTPSYLTILDAATGAVLQNVTLSSMWNVYTTAWQDASPVASYQPYGAGCAGTVGVPQLAAAPGARPALGSTFTVDVDNLPFAVAAIGTGLSNTLTTTGLLLPFDLGAIGMTGCMLLVDPLVLDLIVGAGTSASWSWNIANSQSLFGYDFFNQAFAFDPGANGFGFTASNAGAGRLGF